MTSLKQQFKTAVISLLTASVISTALITQGLNKDAILSLAILFLFLYHYFSTFPEDINTIIKSIEYEFYALKIRHNKHEILITQSEYDYKFRPRFLRVPVTAEQDIDYPLMVNEKCADYKPQNRPEVSSFLDYKTKLKKAIRALEHLKGTYNEKKLKQVILFLREAKTKKADELLKKIEENECKDSLLRSAIIFQRGKIQEAEQQNIEALQHYQKAISLDPENMFYLNEAGVICTKVHGLLPSAEQYFRQALLISTGKGSNEDTAHYQNNLGVTLFYENRIDEALPYLEKSYETFLNIFGEDHQETIKSRDFLQAIKERRASK